MEDKRRGGTPSSGRSGTVSGRMVAWPGAPGTNAGRRRPPSALAGFGRGRTSQRGRYGTPALETRGETAAAGLGRPQRGALRGAGATASGKNRGALYIGVLVGGDCYELGLGEGEGLHSARLVGILCPVFVHLHHMQAGLVLVEGLQNHHLLGRGKEGRKPREEEKIRPRRRGRAMPAGGGPPPPPPQDGCELLRPPRSDWTTCSRSMRPVAKVTGGLPSSHPPLFLRNDTI